MEPTTFAPASPVNPHDLSPRLHPVRLRDEPWVPSPPPTRHAVVRARQRGIPPLVDRWLDEFGEEQHDGHGGIRVYFSQRSVRRMERALGHQPVELFKRYLQAYKVESCRDGSVLTKGWQTRRWWRR